MAKAESDKYADGSKSLTKELQEAADEVAEIATLTDGYAYRFEDMSDGSVLGIYKETPASKIKLKSFPDGDSRYWHPEKNPEGKPQYADEE